MGGEPAIVVGDRKELTYLLCQAAELEHALMCEYLYAGFSLKSAPGPGLRGDQLYTVEGWRQVIFAIASRGPNTGVFANNAVSLSIGQNKFQQMAAGTAVQLLHTTGSAIDGNTLAHHAWSAGGYASQPEWRRWVKGL